MSKNKAVARANRVLSAAKKSDEAAQRLAQKRGRAAASKKSRDKYKKS